MDFTHYQTLGISKTATKQEVKAAFKALAVKYHPDKNPGVPFYEEHFKKINAAYQILSNDQKRALYDAKLENKLIKKKPKPHPDPYFNNKNTPPPPKPKAGSRKKQERYPIRYFFIVFVALWLLSRFGLWFYDFMNNYAAEVRLEEGIAQRNEGNLIESMVSFSEAIRFNSEYSEAYYQRGITRILLYNDYDKTRFDFQNAIKKSKKPSYRYHYQLGSCHAKMKEYPAAVSEIETAIRLNNRFDSGYYLLAEINAYNLGDFEQGLKNFRNVLYYNGDWTNAHLGAGYCLLKLKDLINAQSEFNLVLDKSPGHFEALYYRGITRIAMRDTINGCADLIQSADGGFEAAHEKLREHCR